MQSYEHYTNGDWFLLLALIVGAVIALLMSIRMFHRARLIEDTPTSKIRSASQGYVELFGNAVCMDGPEITAPLTGLPCAWYSFSIEERSEHGKNKWRRIDHGVSDHLFLIKDNTGECVVDPDGANVTPSVTETWYGSRPNRALDSLKLHPAIDVIAKTMAMAGAPYRYTEKRLNLNEPLYAIGEFTSIGTDYRKEIDHLVRDFLNKLKRDKKRLVHYDINQDGDIDQEEWEQARADAKKAAVEEQLSNPLPKSTHLLKKPDTIKRQPFLLSAKGETHLSRDSKIFSVVLAIIFVTLIVGIFFKLFGTI